MSWLEDLEYEHNFKCHCKCECGCTKSIKAHQKPEEPVCSYCGTPMLYKGFTPLKMGGVTKVEYEKNGVKAWRIVDSDGNTRHVAKASEEYYNTAKVDGRKLSTRAMVSEATKGDANEV